MTRHFILILLMVTGVIFTFERSAYAHPSHVTIAEAQFNAKTKSLEVALWVQPIDLENALRRRHNKPIDLDRTPKVDELIVEYLNEVFTVTLAGDQGEMLKGASGNSGVAEVEPPVVQPRSAGSPRSSQKHQNKVGSLKWVGKEVSVKAAWLYFELPLPDGCEGVTLSNRIFLELEANQVNTLNLREGKQKATLHFTREKPKATVSFAPDDSDESTQGD